MNMPWKWFCSTPFTAKVDIGIKGHLENMGQIGHFWSPGQKPASAYKKYHSSLSICARELILSPLCLASQALFTYQIKEIHIFLLRVNLHIGSDVIMTRESP